MVGQEDDSVVTNLHGLAVLRDPLLYKGAAFSPEERAELGLDGLIPSVVETIESQVPRVYTQYQAQSSNLLKSVFLEALRDRNEVLYYRLLGEHLREMLPIVYTPTVAEAIRTYSQEYRRPRGVYLSIDDPDGIERAFRNLDLGPDDVDLVVASDAESILGIGDWGVGGGAGITTGKLAVYTAAAGLDPSRGIPVALDVGTDNQQLLNDPGYIGIRHARIRGQRYDDFIDAYVGTVIRLFPSAMLHWEDFGPANARRILARYADQACSFNDDMQGTGAIVLAALLGAVRVAGTRVRDQRIVVFGAGTAGMGIADQLRDAMVRDGLDRDTATRRIWPIDRSGLLTDDMTDLRDFQAPYARPVVEIANWRRDDQGIGLVEVIDRVKPTMLLGTSAVPGAFNERAVRAMAAEAARPIIFPISNPSERAEAVPADLIAWTDGRALIATGTSAEPITYHGVTYTVGQANNALLYPGLGLGVVVSRARRISEGMLQAAAEAVGRMVDTSLPGASLLPQVEDLREISAAVAVAVAKKAAEERLARVELHNAVSQVRDAMWQPRYRRIRSGER